MARWQRAAAGLTLASAAGVLALCSPSSSSAFLAVPPHAGAAGASRALASAASAADPAAAAAAADSASVGLPAAGLFAAAALAVGVAARAARGTRKRTALCATYGYMQKFSNEEDPKKNRKWWYDPKVRNFWPGTIGYNMRSKPYVAPKPPMRQVLSHISEAMAKYVPSEFYKVPFVSLKAGDVKQMGSCQLKAETAEVVSPATYLTYHHPKTGTRLEKEPGVKRGLEDDESYMERMEKQQELMATVSKTGLSANKDFVAERSALEVLLGYVSETLTVKLNKRGQFDNAQDLVKITKEGGSLVLERLLDMRNTWAGIEYKGAWQRTVMSQHGTFTPALMRLCSGDAHTQSMDCTGVYQIAGAKAGKFDKNFRFVEFDVGGLSFLVRTRSHMATKDGKNVELMHKNWYYRQNTSVLELYNKMLMGGVDTLSYVMHRSGKIMTTKDLSLADVVATKPEVVDAAERRMGRLVALLEKVKAAIAAAPEEDGPWVLQLQRGELFLGRYQQVIPEETAEEKEESEQPQMEDGMVLL